MIKINKKLLLPHSLITLGLAFVLLLSLGVFFIKNHDIRRMFIFPSVEEGKYVVEYRYLTYKPVQGSVNLFIDELLLGSGIERTNLLFTRGTVVESCFVRKNVLYVNLSAQALQMGEGVIDIKDGIDLLVLNINKNFHDITTVEVFIDGKYVFEDLPE